MSGREGVTVRGGMMSPGLGRRWAGAQFSSSAGRYKSFCSRTHPTRYGWVHALSVRAPTTGMCALRAWLRARDAESQMRRRAPRSLTHTHSCSQLTAGQKRHHQRTRKTRNVAGRRARLLLSARAASPVCAACRDLPTSRPPCSSHPRANTRIAHARRPLLRSLHAASLTARFNGASRWYD